MHVIYAAISIDILRSTFVFKIETLFIPLYLILVCTASQVNLTAPFAITPRKSMEPSGKEQDSPSLSLFVKQWKTESKR